jgi:UDP-glucose 4-epimerase
VMVASAGAGSPRVVLAGSMEEPDMGDPAAVAQSPYAASKWCSVAYARHFHALHDLPVVHLRVFMVYGPGQLDRRKLVPYVTVSLLRGEEPRLTSGTRAVDWIYVDDVVEAFLRAAVTPGLGGRSLDVGSGELVTARDLAERLSDLVGGDTEPAFGAIPDRALERVRAADPAPAAEAMGWRPQTSLDDGLAQTVAFYRSQLDSLPPSK